MSRLEEIRQRLAAVTPGPWVLNETESVVRSTYDGYPDAPEYGGTIIWDDSLERNPDSLPDGRFIAHAPADVAWLLQRVTDLEAKLAEARETTSTSEVRDRREQLKRDLETVRRAAGRRGWTPEEAAEDYFKHGRGADL